MIRCEESERVASMYCWKCGKYLTDEANFCTSCGESVRGNTDSIHAGEFHAAKWSLNDGADQSSSTVQTVPAVNTIKTHRNIIVPIIVVVVALVVIFFAGYWYRSMTLGRVMNACENQTDAETWALFVDTEYPVYKLADNNRTLIVDGASPSNDILSCIIKESGMPESVINRIDTTRALDGTLSDSWGNITVSWNYHPDIGLNMVFEVK